MLIEMSKFNYLINTFNIQDLCSNTMLNHYLSQNLKLIEKIKFNHLINTLTANT
jgi:hypothetical protein